MKKLILILATLISTSALHSMETLDKQENKATSNVLDFSCKTCQKPCPCPSRLLGVSVTTMMKYIDHDSIVKDLKHDLLLQNLSICDITSYDDQTVLHGITLDDSWIKKCGKATLAAKIYLEVAGDEVWKLLTAKTSEKSGGHTPLHYAAKKGLVDLVTLYLDTADEQAHVLIEMQDGEGKTAFDIAAPEAKEIIKMYLEKK